MTEEQVRLIDQYATQMAMRERDVFVNLFCELAMSLSREELFRFAEECMVLSRYKRDI